MKIEVTAGLLEDAYALAIAYAATYQHEHGLSEPHPTHAKICRRIARALGRRDPIQASGEHAPNALWVNAMSRSPAFIGFLGPGHRRHAFYRIGNGTQAVPACNRPTEGVIINHTEPYTFDADICSQCKRMVERVKNGVTPPHLEGLQ